MVAWLGMGAARRRTLDPRGPAIGDDGSGPRWVLSGPGTLLLGMGWVRRGRAANVASLMLALADRWDAHRVVPDVRGSSWTGPSKL